nr:MAG TPA: phosphodiesterase [Caudoviricetes sp.]
MGCTPLIRVLLILNEKRRIEKNEIYRNFRRIKKR